MRVVSKIHIILHEIHNKNIEIHWNSKRSEKDKKYGKSVRGIPNIPKRAKLKIGIETCLNSENYQNAPKCEYQSISNFTKYAYIPNLAKWSKFSKVQKYDAKLHRYVMNTHQNVSI